MRRSRGFALIELLGVITVSTALMAVAVGVLHLVLRAEENCRERQNQRVTIVNLAEQFRQDAHAATQFSADQFEISSDHRIAYRRTPDALIREETAANQIQRREQYPVPATVRVEIAPDNKSPRWVTLRMSPEPGSITEPAWKEVKIDALLGLDRRFGGVAPGGDAP